MPRALASGAGDLPPDAAGTLHGAFFMRWRARLWPPPDAALIAELYRQTPATLAGHLLGALVVLMLFRASAAPAVLATWLLCGAGAWAVRLAVAWRHRAAGPVGQQDLQRWQRRWNATCLGCGAAWALAVLLLCPTGDDLQCAGLILIVYSHCIAAPAASYGVFLAYALMCSLPMFWHVSHDRALHTLPMAALVGGGFVVTLLIGAQYRRGLAALLALKCHAEELARALAQEKAHADAARQVAEEATRATTRFFAAASHDLRQPLHAMGLFAETLQRRCGACEHVSIAAQIGESAVLLESLFDELLDLNRLDAGAVQARLAPVPVAQVYARLRLAFEPEAFDRGLALRFRGAHHVVWTDAVLLERILRNLLSNALRCTEDGGVLVGCRRRAGRWQFEVWDSGIGIAPELLPRIFEEFYQVAPRPAGAGRGRGMGLGLAIVQRLAAVLCGEVRVRSWPGQGSVFTLGLAAAPVDGPTPQVAQPALTIIDPSEGT